MGKKNRKVDSKEVGLEIGLILFKFFFESEYLHYGYFTEDMPVKASSLAKAQQNYAELLLGNIPTGVKTILDVGCGSGKFASVLIEKGYQVDCVSPGTILTEHAKKILNGRAEIFNSKFEDSKITKKYDMILFSESFQYIPVDNAFSNALKYMNPGGHIMICDFFKTDAPGESMLGGGHKFSEYVEKVKNYPVTLVKEQDITKETAPTIDLVNQLTMDVIKPTYDLLFLLLEDRFPWIAKFVRWKYKKKLAKMQRKHFEGQRNGANFIKYKKYMFYLYKG